METGININIAQSGQWMPWLFATMALLLWLSCMMQPHYLRSMVSGGITLFTEAVAEQVPSIGSQISQWLFNILVPTITLFAFAQENFVAHAGTTSVALLNILLLAVIAIDVARLIVGVLVGYTFRIGKRLPLVYWGYFSLRSLYSIGLYILVLIMAFATPNKGWLIATAVLMLLYVGAMIVQWVRMFATSVVEGVYTSLYLITVELLPNIALYIFAKHIAYLV